MIRLYLFLFFVTSVCYSDINSTKGTIEFDVQTDNQAEITLNHNGLGIGVTPISKLHVQENAITTDQLAVGGSNGASNLMIHGSIEYGSKAINANTKLGDHSVVLVDSSSDNITLTLPYAGNVIGRQYKIKKVSNSNSVWIVGGGNLIDDTTPIELPESLASVHLISDGTQWYALSGKDESATIAASNLIGWWKLDELAGVSASDSSYLDNNGSITNGATFSDNGITGVVKRGLAFDGVNDYISVPDDNSLDLKYDFSISVWFKTEQGSNNYIVTKNNDSFYVRVDANKIKFWIASSSAAWDTGINNVNDGEWHHLVAMRRGNTKIAYVDGIEEISVATLSNANNTGSTDLRIGFRSSQYFQGSMDDFRIYDKGLTAAEVQHLYNLGL